MSTDANGETLSGNIVTNISHHLAQFCFSFPAKQTPYKKKRKYINKTAKILMLASL